MRASRLLPSVLRRLLAHILDGLRSLACVNLVRALRSVSRVVPLVEVTARSFLWMRYISIQDCYGNTLSRLQFNLHLTGDIHAVTAANNLLGSHITPTSIA